MGDFMPQDEYFEWEDIMVYQSPCGLKEPGKETMSISEFRATSIKSERPANDLDDFDWNEEDDNDAVRTSGVTSITTALSLSTLGVSDKSDSPIYFPTYEHVERDTCDVSIIDKPLSRPVSFTHYTPYTPAKPAPEAPRISSQETSVEDLDTFSLAREHITHPRDDTAACMQPFQNVNYLTHEWCEEDLHVSWRNVVSKRSSWIHEARSKKSSWKPHNNVPRLENAAWRSWAKIKFQCKTVSPECINWMKEHDDTCIYGPFLMNTSSFSNETIISSAHISKQNSRPQESNRSILKSPKSSELLVRSSLHTYSITRTSNSTSPPQTTTMQGRSSIEPHVTPCLSSRKHKVSRPRKSVKFESEVTQYRILAIRCGSPGRKLIQKLPSKTLDENDYFIDITPPPPTPISSHWSPESLWSYNKDATWQSPQPRSDSKLPRSQKSQEKPGEWTWLGIIGEEPPEESTSPLRIQSLPPTSQSSLDAKTLPLGQGSLTHPFSLQFSNTDSEIEDELDYLLSCSNASSSSPPLSSGSLSPPPASSRNSSIGSSDSGSDDGSFEDNGADIADQRGEKGYQFRFGGGKIGIMDEEKRALYEQVMEEFELEY